MGWFDVDEHASGAVAGRLATDAAYLRGAVGDQVAVVAQNLVTCIAGFTLGMNWDAPSLVASPSHRPLCLLFISSQAAVASAGFYYGWQMALLILGIMPFLIVAAWLQTKFTAGAHNKVTHDVAALPQHLPPTVRAPSLLSSHDSTVQHMFSCMSHSVWCPTQTESEFASANVTASESFSSIRTVAAFSMESQIQDLYNDLLTAPAKAASKTALIGCGAVRDETFRCRNKPLIFVRLGASRATAICSQPCGNAAQGHWIWVR